MRRPLFAISLGIVLGLIAIRYAALHFALQKGEVVNCIGFLFLLASAMLLYFQIKSGLGFDRRKATHDFIYGPIAETLLPLEKELKRLINLPTLIFDKGTTIDVAWGSQEFHELHMLLLDILNFYERMAISMRRNVLDEDMLYDDKGAVFLSLYIWVSPLIKDLQTRYDMRAFANVCAIAAQWRERYDKAEGEHKKREAEQLLAKALPKRDLFS